MADQTRLLNSYFRKHGIYQFFIYDANTEILLDMIEDRSYNKVLKYSDTYFRNGTLSTIAIDMWLPYKML